MSKAGKFIQDCTRGCSNELCAVEDRFGKKVISYHEWLTPDQARRAVEIAREETLLEVAAWISDTFIFSKQAKEDFGLTFNERVVMSKAGEKTTELMKKAKDFIPDGGYSEKELNLAFFMFIKGYYQAEKDLELTWEDMEAIQEIANDYTKYHTMESRFFVYKEVLKRFKDLKK